VRVDDRVAVDAPEDASVVEGNGSAVDLDACMASLCAEGVARQRGVRVGGQRDPAVAQVDRVVTEGPPLEAVLQSVVEAVAS